MRFDNIDARVVDQVEDTVELPRTRTVRMFMDEVPSNPKLMPVYRHAKLNVLRCLMLGLLTHLQPFWIAAVYMFIKFLQVIK